MLLPSTRAATTCAPFSELSLLIVVNILERLRTVEQGFPIPKAPEHQQVTLVAEAWPDSWSSRLDWI